MATKKPAPKSNKKKSAPKPSKKSSGPIELAFIGGSGLYQIESFIKEKEVMIKTPWGQPSDKIVIGTIGSQRVAFLPRHNRMHTLLPSEVPYAANIAALKSLGVKTIVSVSACGSLREHLPPETLAIPHQYIDFTKGKRRNSFYGEGVVGHVAAADPVCLRTANLIEASVRGIGEQPAVGSTYICIEGPRFSSRAESHMFRAWNADIIGMTNCPEIFLAREAGIGYATLALVTDFDCWNEEHAAVDVETVLATVHKNVSRAQQVIIKIAESYRNFQPDESFASVGRNSIQSNIKGLTPAVKKRLMFLGIKI